VLVCHAESRLNREGIARWLASFTDLVGLILIEEGRSQTWARVRREVRRIGPLRFLDVIAFRVYYRLMHARTDALWLTGQLDRLACRYGDLPPTVEKLRTGDPSSPEAAEFLRRLAPDLMIARCKRILKEHVFAIPGTGTFVLHPGVCPEYRNAHGAFWALAERDIGKVGLTLLKIDRGVDTGPVYGYYSYEFDEEHESPLVIMMRLVLENLDRLRDKLLEIHRGTAVPLDTRGRPSRVWGQPWLSRYLRWKREARRRRPHARAVA
jgi:Formyl transferase